MTTISPLYRINLPGDPYHGHTAYLAPEQVPHISGWLTLFVLSAGFTRFYPASALVEAANAE